MYVFTVEARYQNGKIYELIHPDLPNKCLYVGFTTYKLSNIIIRNMKSKKHNEFALKHNKKLFTIRLLEEYKCYNKFELAHRTQFWVDKLNPTLNDGCRLLRYEPPAVDYDRLAYEHNKGVRLLS
jgi:hypothetical protein